MTLTLLFTLGAVALVMLSLLYLAVRVCRTCYGEEPPAREARVIPFRSPKDAA